MLKTKFIVLIDLIIITAVVGLFFSFISVGLLCVKNLNVFLFTVLTTVCILISFVLAPVYVMRKVYNFKINYNLKYKIIISHLLFHLVIIILLLILFKDRTSTIYFLAIGYCEEFLFRKLFWDYCKKHREFSTFMTLCITSCVFSFFLHLNDDFITNLLIRLPLGFIFGLIKNKWGVFQSGIVHALYDILIVRLI